MYTYLSVGYEIWIYTSRRTGVVAHADGDGEEDADESLQRKRAGGSGHCRRKRFCGMHACTERAPREPLCGQGATPLPARIQNPLQ